jgi:hypothetical protein
MSIVIVAGLVTGSASISRPVPEFNLMRTQGNRP